MTQALCRNENCLRHHLGCARSRRLAPPPPGPLRGRAEHGQAIAGGRGRALALAAWQHYRQHLRWNAAQQNAWGYLQELRLNADRGTPSRADIAHSP